MMGDYFVRIVGHYYYSSTRDDCKGLVWNSISSMDHLLLWYYVGGLGLGWVILVVLSYFPGMCVCVVYVSCSEIYLSELRLLVPNLLCFVAHLSFCFAENPSGGRVSCVERKRRIKGSHHSVLYSLFLYIVLFGT
jgi:hypothetical protein